MREIGTEVSVHLCVEVEYFSLHSRVELIADLIPLLVLMCSSPFQLLAHYNCIINSALRFFFLLLCTHDGEGVKNE